MRIDSLRYRLFFEDRLLVSSIERFFKRFSTPALGREMIINREYNEGVYVMHRVSTLRVGLQHLQIRDHG